MVHPETLPLLNSCQKSVINDIDMLQKALNTDLIVKQTKITYCWYIVRRESIFGV